MRWTPCALPHTPFIGLVVLAITHAPSGTTAQVIERVSVKSSGKQSNGFSASVALSTDGRYVAFESEATNLVASDTNGRSDIFLRDREARTTDLISISSAGDQGSDKSRAPQISGNGRVIAYWSAAEDLHAGAVNGFVDVFVREVQRQKTRLASPAYDADDSGASGRYGLSISQDGKHVAYCSAAENLVVEDTNDRQDIFVWDRLTGGVERVSVDTDGQQANGRHWGASISADGRLVAFFTGWLTGQAIHLRDRTSDETKLVVQGSHWSEPQLCLSADGLTLVYSDRRDVFACDVSTGQTQTVSVSTSGGVGNKPSESPSVSADGRYVAFHSWASDLVDGDANGTTDVFVRDRLRQRTALVSVSSTGKQGNGGSGGPAISADGMTIGFGSNARNLVPGDTNGAEDIFVAANPFTDRKPQLS